MNPYLQQGNTNMSQRNAPYAGQVNPLQRQSLDQKIQTGLDKGRFVGLTYTCLIFNFTLMAAAAIVAMYSKQFRNFAKAKVTIIVLLILMVVLSLLLLCCEQAIKSFQAIFYILYSFGLAALVGVGVTAAKSMIIVFSIFLILFLVIGLTTFAFTTSNTFGGVTSYLSVVGIVFIGLGIFALFWKDDITSLCYASIIAILFGFYLVYYTKNMAAKYGSQYTDNDYFIAALSVYVELVQLATGVLGMSLF